MSESRENCLKRLSMRSWRRGTKEMDMILGPYSDDKLTGMSQAALDHYDRLLEENDQDLYQWVSGQVETPGAFADLIADIAQHAKTTQVAPTRG